MDKLPAAFAAFNQYAQFIIWQSVPDGAKTKKLPIDPTTLRPGNAHDTAMWMDAATAIQIAALLGDSYGVGLVFTEEDPFFFLDIDNCLQPDGHAWSPLALELCGILSGAAVEVSQSGRGLHIFGRTAAIDHRCRNGTLGLELYTSGRFVALTGTGATGDVSYDATAGLADIVERYFAPTATTDAATQWTTEPVPGWQGETDDEKLIQAALASRGAASVFGGSASFADLWTANADVLDRAYPGSDGGYDASRVDGALAQHLAFWTGGNCARIEGIMRQSALVREKWERRDYIESTIAGACSRQTEYHGMDAQETDAHNAPPLRGGTPKQRKFAEKLRADVLQNATPEQRQTLIESKPAELAGFWLTNKGAAIETILAASGTIDAVESAPDTTQPQPVQGFQYLTQDLQLDLFKGCVYILELHRILTPNGELLRTEQFNAWYGGYLFQLDAVSDKTTRKAWDAFTESQLIRWPKAGALCFRPDLEPGAFIEMEGRRHVNAYIPIETDRTPGDITPFLNHLEKLLPNETDRTILLSYMAACIQHKGVKFQWAPLLQGTEGNGKTLFTRCVAYAIGRRYTHYPKASDIDNKFNGWLLNKLFIGVEDIYVPDHRREILETLKPMITGGDGLEIQMKGIDQITADICANFILNSNHKDAIRKTQNDRRFAVFYTAQQTASDLMRDGMTGQYFPDLYRWLRAGGYAAVNDYLCEYQISDRYNPAVDCHRAPTTSSTGEAIAASLGGVEQEIMEAIGEGLPGFADGWVSSVAMDRLLSAKGLARRVPVNRRREILQSLGYDWHPALTSGRVNNPVAVDGGKKPRLFVRTDSPYAAITSVSEAVEKYQMCQRESVSAEGAATFGG